MTYPSLASPKSEKPSPLLAEELIRQVSTYSSRIDDQVLVFDSGYWKGDHEMWKSVQKASWEDVVLEETFKKSLQHEYKSFFESEEIYRELGVPWKRGIIFLGVSAGDVTFLCLRLYAHLALQCNPYSTLRPSAPWKWENDHRQGNNEDYQCYEPLCSKFQV